MNEVTKRKPSLRTRNQHCPPVDAPSVDLSITTPRPLPSTSLHFPPLSSPCPAAPPPPARPRPRAPLPAVLLRRPPFLNALPRRSRRHTHRQLPCNLGSPACLGKWHPRPPASQLEAPSVCPRLHPSHPRMFPAHRVLTTDVTHGTHRIATQRHHVQSLHGIFIAPFDDHHYIPHNPITFDLCVPVATPSILPRIFRIDSCHRTRLFSPPCAGVRAAFALETSTQ